jgi:hypothetical protein
MLARYVIQTLGYGLFQPHPTSQRLFSIFPLQSLEQ